MNEEIDLFKPESEEPDVKSKPSFLEHISYRLRLNVPIETDNSKGMLSTSELRILAEKIIFFVDGASLDNDAAGRSYMNALSHRYNAKGEQDRKLKFLDSKLWNDLSKPQYAQIIALVLRFQLIDKGEVDQEDTQPYHINENNGAIYLPFYAEIYNRLPDPELKDDGFELTEEYVDRRKLERNPTTKTISQLLEMDSAEGEEGTTVPEFQRDNTQWSLASRQLMIDSIMHNIPMPALVLGKSRDRPEDPWQVIDGHQRLTTMKFLLTMKMKTLSAPGRFILSPIT